MPIQVRERNGKHVSTGRNTSADVPYLVSGTTDEDAARLAVLEQTDSMFVLPEDGRTLLREGIADFEEVGEGSGFWLASVRYNTTGASVTAPTPAGTKVSGISFNTQGDTQHIKVAPFGHVSTYDKNGAASGTAAKWAGQLNPRRDQEPEGIDIQVPAIEFSETWRYPKGAIDADYLKIVAALTWGVHAYGTFRTFEEGEVLFMGAEGQENEESIDVTYRFKAQSNQEDVVVGSGDDEITIPFKYGWHHLGVLFKPQTSSNQLVQVPEYVFLDRVYPGVDLRRLGIGS